VNAATFRFLRELADNNDRDWFAANRERYERDVREPALEFIADVGELLDRVSPHFVADPRRSMFRIHRDVRFSKDKSPYKTNVGIQFRHAAGRDAHAPGFYLHLDPAGCFAGAGVWHPDAAVLRRIREAIVARPGDWARAREPGRGWRLGGDELKRPPRGFDPAHEFVDDLRRKDFIALRPLTQKQVCSAALALEYVGMCADAKPFVEFLCQAAGVES